MLPVPPAASILASLGQATFAWDLASDAIAWSHNVATVFPDIPVAALASGTELAKLIEPMRSVRSDALGQTGPARGGEGVPYRIEYGVRAVTSAPVIWIEETGCWFAGADGRPARVQGVVRINNERHARDEQLVKLSRHDPLTNELNRTHLIASLAESIEECARFRTSCAFMLIGIDHLARVNDAFGFDVADAVIAEVAKRIRARLRSGDMLGRFSGNKFGLILRNCTVDDTNVAAERFLAAVRDEVVPTRSGPVSVTVSIGAVTIPRHAKSAEEAVNRAQETLDAAKGRRAGSFALWKPNVERDAQRRVNIRVTDEIVTALNERRIVIGFEPVVDARSRQPSFYECLVRMEQEDGQALLAPDIVPVAERLGLIRMVDHRVLELAIAELASAPGVQLSLNISPDTTMDPDWWATIESLMHAHPGVGERLIVEITETVAIQDIDDVRGFVTRLKNFGSRIAIDDFGAGYTSFRNLRKLGVDIVKIDGAFVQNIVRSADDRAFVQTLIDLARRLEIKTVAEWVQDEEAAVMLREWGCDFIQGRLIGLASPDRPWNASAEKVVPAAG
ncbi:MULTISPECIES: bifunctional diguanylate cyclase/phosphodiesterase [unclassified Bradyrhizobium]|uniref:putative bifunctional diguanylate cyclase/phosphodiesterase n=1 Tax=unclassified Bradyrhizobium TaxID=2631580 RepID=UPI001BAA419B|nr:MULTISPECIES: bifunctional diguanylate cyclase/phosphodiesterase [unclassified Bradyrhizobium]MBR1205011.1 bifunctional diguanylate cyclase/phosphodiesterase [Bradyrhizobium sp. AUGA SZCCT0124]MBR1312097.1 bifunctional diguanylate cyclase/phosphodiesterase [Bradyrhizobium sp. AUGA SZCCT0051]MBR1343827.1 bifunctional diguanylate cyclase/phosphodiesterase [Bradyrhizobium sp. AUGA SZCCT0105]MBR1358368.1 bifunctional diguanylate cyclase/phosphodiesterase [Bradyrhizobium sp. AUGA SZCCT0045]